MHTSELVALSINRLSMILCQSSKIQEVHKYTIEDKQMFLLTTDHLLALQRKVYQVLSILSKGCMICQCYSNTLPSTLPVAAVLVAIAITVTICALIFVDAYPLLFDKRHSSMHNPPALYPPLATISSCILLLLYEPCLDVHDATLPPDV